MGSKSALYCAPLVALHKVRTTLCLTVLAEQATLFAAQRAAINPLTRRLAASLGLVEGPVSSRAHRTAPASTAPIAG